MLSVVRAITDLGDLAVLLPLALCTGAALWVLHSRQAALAWAVACVACLATMLVLKVTFHVCGPSLSWLRIVSPSGHASFSAMVYGSIVFLLAYQADGWKRLAIGLAGVVGVAMIAWSRIFLHAHNRREVVVGLAVGILSAAIFLARVHFTRQRQINARATVPLTLVVILALHGCRLPAEEVIDRMPSVACLG